MRLKSFISGVQAELKKASWPTRQELKDSAWAVVVSMLLLGLFIGVVDFIFSRLVTLLLNM